MKRLKIIQKQLYENQYQMNKSLEGKIVNVLVENFTKDNIKLFGRTEYMTSVLFNGSKKDIGKILPIKITKSNRNSLLGEVNDNSNMKVA